MWRNVKSTITNFWTVKKWTVTKSPRCALTGTIGCSLVQKPGQRFCRFFPLYHMPLLPPVVYGWLIPLTWVEHCSDYRWSTKRNGIRKGSATKSRPRSFCQNVSVCKMVLNLLSWQVDKQCITQIQSNNTLPTLSLPLIGFPWSWVCTNHKFTPLLSSPKLLDSYDVNLMQNQELQMDHTNCSLKPYSKQKLWEICALFVLSSFLSLKSEILYKIKGISTFIRNTPTSLWNELTEEIRPILLFSHTLCVATLLAQHSCGLEVAPTHTTKKSVHV